MTRDLSRLLRPKSVAVIGGGAWCASVVQQLKGAGYQGDIWPVHPKAETIEDLPAFSSVDDLPKAPDASFVGINRDATIDTIAALSARNAGGAVCFASGFSEVDDGQMRNQALLDAAGDMPILGPNCYGMINNLDGALLWPDQHGCVPVEKGVAILTQSSNIAINMSMQNRALPISYMVTCGNQAQTSQAQIALALLDDPRVTAIGVHIEGFGRISDWETLARKAQEKNISIVALKVGKSTEAQEATISHTASLAGQDAGAQAFLDRLGIARVDDIATFLETLKILHVTGPLPNTDIATISCSGGEASIAADLAQDIGLRFPELSKSQFDDLSAALGPKVTIANPLDYHTYIWRDSEAMSEAFSAILDPNLALSLFIVDFPRPDRCDASDWECAIEAVLNAKATGKGRVAMVATLPELMPEDVAHRLIAGGVVPLSGFSEALKATKAAVACAPTDLETPVLIGEAPEALQTLREHDAKTALIAHGLDVPASASIALDDLTEACANMTFPLVLKGEGFAHKTENNAVALGLDTVGAVEHAANAMGCDRFLIEEMVTDTVAELIIGVARDPAHGFVLTLGAGGILTELLDDKVNLLVPASQTAFEHALDQLKINTVLSGYRGKPAANRDAIIAAAMAIQDYVVTNASDIAEVEVNPLICTENRAVAVDALIRKSHD